MRLLKTGRYQVRNVAVVYPGEAYAVKPFPVTRRHHAPPYSRISLLSLPRGALPPAFVL